MNFILKCINWGLPWDAGNVAKIMRILQAIPYHSTITTQQFYHGWQNSNNNSLPSWHLWSDTPHNLDHDLHGIWNIHFSVDKVVKKASSPPYLIIFPAIKTHYVWLYGWGMADSPAGFLFCLFCLMSETYRHYILQLLERSERWERLNCNANNSSKVTFTLFYIIVGPHHIHIISWRREMMLKWSSTAMPS